MTVRTQKSTKVKNLKKFGTRTVDYNILVGSRYTLNLTQVRARECMMSFSAHLTHKIVFPKT